MTRDLSETEPRTPLWREPLVGFVLFGITVVAIDIATGGLPDGADSAAPAPVSSTATSTTIEITDALVEDIARELEVRLARAPTDDEVTRAVDQWIHEEVFVREALARDLHVDDSVIRAHLARKMTELFESREVPPEPTDDELRALYEATLPDWSLETELTVRQLLTSGTAARDEAELLLARLVAGDDPLIVGRDRPSPPGGPVLQGRTIRRLASVYGSRFAEGLDTAPIGVWMLRESSMGWHIIRIEERRDGGPVAFDNMRDRLTIQWQSARVDEAAAHALETVYAAYNIVGWPR